MEGQIENGGCYICSGRTITVCGGQTGDARDRAHCTVHPPLSLCRRFEPLGSCPTIGGSSRSVSAPDTADTAEKDVIRDIRSDLSAPLEIWRRCCWLDATLPDAVAALRMLAEFGDVLLLETDRGRSRSAAGSPALFRLSTECFRVTCRVPCEADAADDWLSWSIVREDLERLNGFGTLNAVGGWTPACRPGLGWMESMLVRRE